MIFRPDVAPPGASLTRLGFDTLANLSPRPKCWPTRLASAGSSGPIRNLRISRRSDGQLRFVYQKVYGFLGAISGYERIVKCGKLVFDVVQSCASRVRNRAGCNRSLAPRGFRHPAYAARRLPEPPSPCPSRSAWVGSRRVAELAFRVWRRCRFRRATIL